jgi:AbiV family abortive infection protein
LALAVTGLEETSKGMILWFLGMGRVGERHHAALVKAAYRKHVVKQATAVALRTLGGIMAVAQRTLRKSNLTATGRPPRTRAQFASALKRLGPAMQKVATEVAETYAVSGEAVAADADIQARREGALEQRRQRGLYTDLIGGQVVSPKNITRGEAVRMVADLRACLVALKPLIAVVEFDDEAMDELVAVIEEAQG